MALAHEVGDRAREVARATAQVEHAVGRREGQRLEERAVVHPVMACVRGVVLPVPFGEECHALFHILRRLFCHMDSVASAHVGVRCPCGRRRVRRCLRGPGARAPARASGRAGGAGDARELPPLLSPARRGGLGHDRAPPRRRAAAADAEEGARHHRRHRLDRRRRAHRGRHRSRGCAPRPALPGPRARARIGAVDTAHPRARRRGRRLQDLARRDLVAEPSARAARGRPRPSRRRPATRAAHVHVRRWRLCGRRGARRARVAHPRRAAHVPTLARGRPALGAHRGERHGPPEPEPPPRDLHPSLPAEPWRRRHARDAAHVVRRQARRDRGRQHEGLPHGHARVDRGPAAFAVRRLARTADDEGRSGHHRSVPRGARSPRRLRARRRGRRARRGRRHVAADRAARVPTGRGRGPQRRRVARSRRARRRSTTTTAVSQ